MHMLGNEAAVAMSSLKLAFLACALAGATGTYVYPETCSGPKLTYHDGVCQVAITGTVLGLGNDALHGWHVHETPDISDPTGKGTGGHLNLGHTDHALPGKGTGHTGDLGNLQPNKHGIATIDTTYFRGRSTKDFKNRALIIHAKADSGGQPTGDAGARLAQCVIHEDIPKRNCAGPKLKCTLSSTTSKTLEGGVSAVTGELHFSEKYHKGVCKVAITGKVKGLGGSTPHGWHIHETPDISDPTGAATGGHLNLLGSLHGLPSEGSGHRRSKKSKSGGKKIGKNSKRKNEKKKGKKRANGKGKRGRKSLKAEKGKKSKKRAKGGNKSSKKHSDRMLDSSVHACSDHVNSGRHTGDLGNLYPNASGVADLGTTYIDGRTRDFKNRALIVHAKEDTGGQPTGDAGARLAQCVFEEA